VTKLLQPTVMSDDGYGGGGGDLDFDGGGIGDETYVRSVDVSRSVRLLNHDAVFH